MRDIMAGNHCKPGNAAHHDRNARGCCFRKTPSAFHEVIKRVNLLGAQVVDNEGCCSERHSVRAQ